MNVIVRKSIVQLHAACIEHGGREEYPDGRQCFEIVPPSLIEMATSEGIMDETEAVELYKSSGPVRLEGLRLIALTTPFVGKVAGSNRSKVKTKKVGGLYAMWVPSTLLVPVPVPAPPPADEIALPTAA